jgi:hypothetical protein
VTGNFAHQVSARELISADDPIQKLEAPGIGKCLRDAMKLLALH